MQSKVADKIDYPRKENSPWESSLLESPQGLLMFQSRKV